MMLYGIHILIVISFTHYKANPIAAIIYLSSIGGTRLKKVGQSGIAKSLDL